MSRQSCSSVVEEFAARAAGEQRVGDHLVAAAQLFDALGQRPFLAFGGRDHIEQRIGDAAARGQHDAEPRMRILFENPRDALHAHRIGDAGAAEFMNAPPFHFRISCCSLKGRPRKPPPVRRMTTGQDRCRHSGTCERWEGDTLLEDGISGKSLWTAALCPLQPFSLIDPMYRAGRRRATCRPLLRPPPCGNPGRAKQIVSPGSGWAVAAACSFK